MSDAFTDGSPFVGLLIAIVVLLRADLLGCRRVVACRLDAQLARLAAEVGET